MRRRRVGSGSSGLHSPAWIHIRLVHAPYLTVDCVYLDTEMRKSFGSVNRIS